MPTFAALPAFWGELMSVAFVASLGYVAWNVMRMRSFIAELGERLMLLVGTSVRLPHLLKRRSWLLKQLYAAGIANLHVVLLVGLFIGMILCLQTGIELARFGQQDQIGVLVATGLAREMAPFVTAIILAATFGSALAAELGTMAVSDELAALEVMSVDHVSFLILPRVVALAIICPMMTVLCNAIGVLGGGFVADAQLDVSWPMYMGSVWLALENVGEVISLPKDMYAGLLKSFVFGIIIAVVSCHAGLQARGGALGVGRATSTAVRDSIIAVIISNYFMTWFLYQA